MRVIWVKVGENPTVISNPHHLEYMQELVGGLTEVVEPFSDDIVLVCNENGRNRFAGVQILDAITYSGDSMMRIDCHDSEAR